MTFDAPMYLQNSSLFEYSARQDRLLTALFFTEGVLDVGTMARVTPRAAAANLSVDVAPFDAVIAGDDIPRQGSYFVSMTEGQNVPTDGPPEKGTRWDLLVCEVLDSEAITLNGRPEGVRLRVVHGDVATTGTPVEPALPPTAIGLAAWQITAGQTAILDFQIKIRAVQSARHPEFEVNFHLTVDSLYTSLLDTAQRNIASSSASAVLAMNTTTNAGVKNIQDTKTAATTDITNAVAQGKTDLNTVGASERQQLYSKFNTYQSQLSQGTEFSLNSINTAGSQQQAAITALGATKTGALQALSDAFTASLTDLGTAQSTKVTQAGTSATQAITSTATDATNAIAAARAAMDAQVQAARDEFSRALAEIGRPESRPARTAGFLTGLP